MSDKHTKDEREYFDAKEVVTKYSKKCSYSELSNSNGIYNFNFACIPTKAKDSSDAFCYKCTPEKMPSYFDCSYFFSGYWQTDSTQFENMTCVGNCQGPPEARVIGAAAPSSTANNYLGAALMLAVIIWFSMSITHKHL